MSRTWLTRFMRGWPSRLILRTFRTRVVGLDNIPEGGALLAGNHVSYLDPILIWCAVPRDTFFMAKSELWESRFTGWFLDRVGAFPVKRGEPDRAAINRATGLLAAGELVGMFPEGSRAERPGLDVGAAHGGVAFIALRANVPVVPVAIAGTDRAWPRGQRLPRRAPVAIVVGSPIVPADVCAECGRRERMAALTERIMSGIVEALAVAREEMP